MKTRNFHFVCFLLLLATLGAGDSASFTARLLVDGVQVSDSAAPGKTAALVPLRTPVPVAHACLQTQPATPSTLRTVWPVRPPAAQATSLQADTARPLLG